MQRQARHRGSFINDTLSLVWYLFTEQIPCNPHSYICILGNLLPLGADVILERSPGWHARPTTDRDRHSLMAYKRARYVHSRVHRTWARGYWSNDDDAHC